MKEKNYKSTPNNDFLKLSGIGLEISIFNILLFLGAYYLDNYLELSIHWLTIAAIPFAVIGTIFYLLKKTNKK